MARTEFSSDEEQDMELDESEDGAPIMASKWRCVYVEFSVLSPQQEEAGRRYVQTVRLIRYRRPVSTYRTRTERTSCDTYFVTTMFSFGLGGRVD